MRSSQRHRVLAPALALLAATAALSAPLIAARSASEDWPFVWIAATSVGCAVGTLALLLLLRRRPLLRMARQAVVGPLILAVLLTVLAPALPTAPTPPFARRAAEQVAERGIRIERLSSGLNNLTQVEARAVEQLRIIETGSEGTMNRINSIAYRNPLFSDLMILAEDVLEQVANPAKPIDDILRILE